MSITEMERIAAACRVIAAACGKVEVGHAGEWVPDQRAWWASARTPLGRYFAEHQPSAAEALIVLAEKLLELGRCERCGRQIQVLQTGTVALGTGDGGIRLDTCLWSRSRGPGGRIVWVASC